MKYAKLFVKLSLFRDFPRSILELVSVGGVFSIILTLLFKTEGNLNSIIPNITVFAFGGVEYYQLLENVSILFITKI